MAVYHVPWDTSRHVLWSTYSCILGGYPYRGAHLDQATVNHWLPALGRRVCVLPWLTRPWLPPDPPPPAPGADRTPAVSRRLLHRTKPLRAPRLDKERPTRGLGTPLDDAPRCDLEEMPVDHGNESLKLVARVIRSPTIHQLGEDAHQMGIQDFAPNVPSIRPPVLRAVQRRRPADVYPWLIPDRRDDQPWPAVWL